VEKLVKLKLIENSRRNEKTSLSKPIYIGILPTLTPHSESLYRIIIYLVMRRERYEEESEKKNRRGNDKTPVDGK